VAYIPETENVLADVLLCIYSSEAPDTEHSRTEYMFYDVVNNDTSIIENL